MSMEERLSGAAADIIAMGDDQTRYLDSDSPLAHEFRPGIILPESCLICGAPQAALWHVGGSK